MKNDPESDLNDNPKVFVSHASEDKDRFVIEFAAKLRARGIDAWLDKWEILPGDSLVDKIFEEGLKNARAVIVVLSKNSVGKPWVKEELNSAVIKRINGISKLIPVVIEDCEIPEALRSIVWERIADLKNYDPELERIVMSIYNRYDKPAVSQPPAYVRNSVTNFLSGVTSIDNLVFKAFCDSILASDFPRIGRQQIFKIAESLDVSREELSDTLSVLSSHNYIKGEWTADGTIWDLTMTARGFDLYAEANIKDYDELVNSILFRIVNHDTKSNRDLAEAVNQPLMVVNFILWGLERKGHIRAVWSNMGGEVSSVSVELKRKLRNNH